jgi:hypothetical protein
MPLLGQASGGWTESSSALRLLNLGIRNSIATGTDDSFTQANPVNVKTNVSAKLNPTLTGILSGSVAFTRPDQGSVFVGGPSNLAAIAASTPWAFKPLGLFINNALGNPYENLPGVASGVLPYVCGMGTYGNQLYETSVLVTTNGTVVAAAGTAITYTPGVALVASVNGFMMPLWNSNGANLDQTAAAGAGTGSNTAEGAVLAPASAVSVATTIAVLRMVPDAVQTELVFDSRI